jgi:hypothetical protein
MSIAIPPKLAAKAGPIGPGSGPLLTEFPLSAYAKPSAQKKMQKAWALSFEVPWIAAAEDAITERFAGVEWHLEDENDDAIDDAYPNQDAQLARTLIEKPAANLPVGAAFYRSDLWALTARAMGICGSSFIFLDQPERVARTPAAMLPIAPWRMSPNEDSQGNLLTWQIDKTQTSPGIEVSLEQILHYKLRPNFAGHFGVGLVESALRKAQITTGLDDHIGLVLSGGGRLSGILSPKTGIVGGDEILQMERDWRTIVEQSDAAKRLQLVRAPIQFDRTTLTPDELKIRDLMVGSRDDLLALWGVPLSIIGGSTPAGLNSGDTRKYDEAAIWQGPIHHRLNVFREITQYQLLDRWRDLGVTIELEIDEPEFDDDSPRYDLLGKSVNVALTDDERRALIGKEPLPNGLGLMVRLPATIVESFAVPSVDETPSITTTVLGRAAQQQLTSGDSAMLAAGETKAALHPRVQPLHQALIRIRNHMASKVTPRLQSSVAQVLTDQRHDIAARLREHADHVTKNPRDTSTWFDKGWDAKLHKALVPHLTVMAEAVVAQVHDVLPAKPHKAGPVGAVERTLNRGAARVTGINETTRAKIQEAIIRGLEDGLSVLDVADLIEESGTVGGLEMGALFDEYRAEMIARTELMDAYNGAAIGSYSDAGITQVEAIDGDGDEECAARDGQTFGIDEADAIEDHPNGTLDWVPVIGEEVAIEGKAAVSAPVPVTTPQNFNFNFPEGMVRVEHHAGDVHVAAAEPQIIPPAQIDVHVPDQPAPIVNTVVNVPETPAPIVNVAGDTHIVNVPEPSVTVVDVKPTRKVIDRDRTGTITGIHEEN